MVQDPLTLFRSELQLRLLHLLLEEPEQARSNRELRERLGGTEASIHRELQRARRSGLVVREPVGRTYRYRASPDSPLYEPLRELLRRLVGMERELAETLRDEPGVEAAAIHGSWVTGDLRPTSDLDLVVIGRPDLHSVRRRLRPLERAHGRRIDLTIFDREEFESMLRRGNSLARAVTRGPVEVLVGELRRPG